jgi:hypothetical protein
MDEKFNSRENEKYSIAKSTGFSQADTSIIVSEL